MKRRGGSSMEGGRWRRKGRYEASVRRRVIFCRRNVAVTSRFHLCRAGAHTHTHTHTHTHPMCNDPNFHMHGSVRWEGGPSVSPPSARPSSSLGRRGAWPWGERRTLGKTESPSEDVLSLVGGGLARPDGPDCQRPGRGSRGTESDRERGGGTDYGGEKDAFWVSRRP